jgi:curved DNA-binding protein CbpA
LSTDQQFVDYYDLLQVSPNADTDTIRRVFRHLAKKCHPDLHTGGDPERFRQMLKAHEILANAETRAAYDLRYQEYWDRKWQLLRQAGDGKSWMDNSDLRDRLLSLLYVQRRTNTRSPGLGDMELARLLRVDFEFLEFELWYLREKGWVQRLDTGLLAISVDGVDKVEQGRLRPNEDRLLAARNPEQPREVKKDV